MISIRRISLGGGFRYLIDSVARGDGETEPSSSLAAYYAESGTPAGAFLGSGLADLDGGKGLEPGLEGERGAPVEHVGRVLRSCEWRYGRLASEEVRERPCGRLRSLLQPTEIVLGSLGSRR